MLNLRRVEGLLIDTNRCNNLYMSASMQLLLGSCMYNFLPAKNSVSSELLENLNFVHKKSYSIKQRCCSICFQNEIRKFICQEKCFRRNFVLCYSSRLKRRVTLRHHLQSVSICESITGNSRKENYLRVAVFAMSQATNLKSLLWRQYFCSSLQNQNPGAIIL